MTDTVRPTQDSALNAAAGPPGAQRDPHADPHDFEAAHVLRDGTPIVVRAVRHGDEQRFARAFDALGKESVYTRFFGHKKELTQAELDQAVNVDFDRIVALVVTTRMGDEEAIIAGGRYVRDTEAGTPLQAEIAFTVQDAYQGQGIARHLLGHLARIARAKGIAQFNADVLASNAAMLAVFERSGLPMRRQWDHDVVHVTLAL